MELPSELLRFLENIDVSQKNQKSEFFVLQLTPVVFIGYMSQQKKFQHYKYAYLAYLAIFGIFGCIFGRAQYGQVGCP